MANGSIEINHQTFLWKKGGGRRMQPNTKKTYLAIWLDHNCERRDSINSRQSLVQFHFCSQMWQNSKWAIRVIWLAVFCAETSLMFIDIVTASYGTFAAHQSLLCWSAIKFMAHCIRIIFGSKQKRCTDCCGTKLRNVKQNRFFYIIDKQDKKCVRAL